MPFFKVFQKTSFKTSCRSLLFKRSFNSTMICLKLSWEYHLSTTHTDQCTCKSSWTDRVWNWSSLFLSTGIQKGQAHILPNNHLRICIYDRLIWICWSCKLFRAGRGFGRDLQSGILPSSCTIKSTEEASIVSISRDLIWAAVARSNKLICILTATLNSPPFRQRPIPNLFISHTAIDDLMLGFD